VATKRSARRAGRPLDEGWIGMEGYGAGATELFLENLRRYLGGERLVDAVSKRKGYQAARGTG
jgi:hypothetical protein